MAKITVCDICKDKVGDKKLRTLDRTLNEIQQAVDKIKSGHIDVCSSQCILKYINERVEASLKW